MSTMSKSPSFPSVAAGVTGGLADSDCSSLYARHNGGPATKRDSGGEGEV